MGAGCRAVFSFSEMFDWLLGYRLMLNFFFFFFFFFTFRALRGCGAEGTGNCEDGMGIGDRGSYLDCV
jgi:hypothetical protein